VRSCCYRSFGLYFGMMGREKMQEIRRAGNQGEGKEQGVEGDIYVWYMIIRFL
jgi:hypothetical protein